MNRMLDGRSLSAAGGISLRRASVGGDLDLRGADLANRHGEALRADELTVAQSVLCGHGFTAAGGISLRRASVGGDLDLRDADLASPGGEALRADELTVDHLFCGNGFHADRGVNLREANINVLHDDVRSWPLYLNLDGTVYRDLKPYLPARMRIDRLARQDYRPQPYDQLTAYYYNLGHNGQARRVQLAKQRRQTVQRPPWRRLWGWLQDILAGYGYAPERIAAWFVVLFIFGCTYFTIVPPLPAFPGRHQSFSAPLYTLDLLLPVPYLGQVNAWNPQGDALIIASGLRILGLVLAAAAVVSIIRLVSMYRTQTYHAPQPRTPRLSVEGRRAATQTLALPRGRARGGISPSQPMEAIDLSSIADTVGRVVEQRLGGPPLDEFEGYTNLAVTGAEGNLFLGRVTA